MSYVTSSYVICLRVEIFVVYVRPPRSFAFNVYDDVTYAYDDVTYVFVVYVRPPRSLNETCHIILCHMSHHLMSYVYVRPPRSFAFRV